MDVLILIGLFIVGGLLVWPFLAAQRQKVDDVLDLGEDVVPRCPTCGYDVRATGERCPECGERVPKERRPLDSTKLRDDWPPAPIDVREPAAGEALVVVWHAPHAMAATLLVEQLRARGVKAGVQARPRSMRVGEYVPAGDDHAVAVWSGDAERVDKILARFAR